MEKRKRPLKVRRFFKINPRTRVAPSGKRYERSRMKRETRGALEKEVTDHEPR